MPRRVESPLTTKICAYRACTTEDIKGISPKALLIDPKKAEGARVTRPRDIVYDEHGQVIGTVVSDTPENRKALRAAGDRWQGRSDLVISPDR